LNYYYNRIQPVSDSVLVLKNPAGQQREETIPAKVQRLPLNVDYTTNDIGRVIRESENAGRQVRQRYVEMGDVFFWKSPEFILDEPAVDHIFSIARKHKALVLDLRGNLGGEVLALERIVGNVFDHDVKIADRTGRQELKPELAKSVGKDAFAGKIIVLIDSGTVSAAEPFARVIQLEKRGIVIGDISSGRVMEAKHYVDSQTTGLGSTEKVNKVSYGFSITGANLIMADGKSLEHTGVIPDEIVLPTGLALAQRRDPVLVHAAQLAGLSFDSKLAGEMFPFEWLPMN
jgi:Peptidase family S41